MLSTVNQSEHCELSELSQKELASRCTKVRIASNTGSHLVLQIKIKSSQVGRSNLSINTHYLT